jgi:hypothetical protein
MGFPLEHSREKGKGIELPKVQQNKCHKSPGFINETCEVPILWAKISSTRNLHRAIVYEQFNIIIY